MKHDNKDFQEFAPSYNYFDWETQGDDFADFEFQKFELDWDGKPAVLAKVLSAAHSENSLVYLGGLGILERLINAKTGHIFRIRAGAKTETGAGRTFRHYTILTPKNQDTPPPTNGQKLALRERMEKGTTASAATPEDLPF